VAKTGRNERCPCGSGKKYKNCCLRKDQEAQAARGTGSLLPAALPPVAPDRLPVQAPREMPALPPAPPKAPAKPVDPHQAALEARWKEFEEADYPGRVELFLRTLDEKELMDEENAFEMVNQLSDDMARHGERDRFAELVGALRERLPEVYASHAGYYASFLIENAVCQRNFEALPELGAELARHGEKIIDIYTANLDMLAYHGQLAVLLSMVRQSWPSIKASTDIVPWGIHEFRERAGDYEIFTHIEQSASPDGSDPALIERLEVFIEVLKRDKLIEYVELVSGKRRDTYALDDFDLLVPKKARRSEWDEEDEEEEEAPTPPGHLRLYNLSLEFLGWLRREEGVPFTKGELARDGIVRYLIQRANGELEKDGAPRKGKAARRPDPLSPDRQTLDRFLAADLGFLNFRKHVPVAVFELMPAWLRFLQSRNLLGAEQRRRIVEELRPLAQSLLKYYEHYLSDTNLQEALRNWGKEPAPAGPA
jgi:hypothetical protein